MDAVRQGMADIGFVARNPERAGPVQFSQPYMLVQQTFLVSQAAPIKSVADLDRTNRKLGATRADSIALYLARTIRQATLVELDAPSADTVRQMILDGRLDAFGANRQRLTDMLRTTPGLRLLPDDLYGVEQTIIVANDRPDLLKAVNQFIDEVRASGFLRSSIERSGVVGIAVAPRSP
jgi:polar amino acid transport system substrate-binding protein